ncbi:MAG: glycoside hydrolase family 9 protein [Actinomycetota bacterium]
MPTAAPAAPAFVRVNQVGYDARASKTAYLLSAQDASGETFRVVDEADGADALSATVGPDRGRWNAEFGHVYDLDLTSLDTPGTYHVTVDGAVSADSPPFVVATAGDLYGPLARDGLLFFQAQRDGPDVVGSVLDRKPAHLNDARALIYATPQYRGSTLVGKLRRVGGPVDVSGGWFDAGDYLKFTVTTTFAVAMLLSAIRDEPDVLGSDRSAFEDEVAFGLDWLQRMWDGRRLLIQVGIGEGDGCRRTCADHDLWRLPEDDDTFGGTKSRFPFIRHRPVFQTGANGAPLSPNLGGRLAADFALCFQVFRTSRPSYAADCLQEAEAVFDRSDHWWKAKRPVTAARWAYYQEQEWRDDLELGAAELALALQGADGAIPGSLPHPDPAFYVQKGAAWAKAYITGPHDDGSESFTLYDTSGLAHAELAMAMQNAGSPGGLAVSQDDLVTDLEQQVAAGEERSAHDPFRNGFPLNYGVVPHVLGLSIGAGLYDRLTGTTRFTEFAERQLDWALGANAWGTSFVIGAGSTFPHCPQHQIANLSGSLDGTPPVLTGATVAGPTATGDFRGLEGDVGGRTCPADGVDRFRRFSIPGVRYVDAVWAWPSVEPALDYSVIALVAFARAAAGLT